jgi:pyruvate formate lyase activating enzyme
VHASGGRGRVLDHPGAVADHALAAGLRYVYTGNIHDEAGQSTYCHGCGATLIGRDWYDLTAWNLTADGRCADCGARCAGVFDAAHGHWGARRRSVKVQAFAEP